MVSSVSTIAVMMFPMSVSAFEGSVDATAQVALLNREVSPPGFEACLRLYYLSGEQSTTADLMDNGEFDVADCITNNDNCHDAYKNRIQTIFGNAGEDDYLVAHCWDRFKGDTDAHKRLNDNVRGLIVDSREKKSFERVVELLQKLVDADNVDGIGSEDLSGEQKELFLAVKAKMTNLRDQCTSAAAQDEQVDEQTCNLPCEQFRCPAFTSSGRTSAMAARRSPGQECDIDQENHCTQTCCDVRGRNSCDEFVSRQGCPSQAKKSLAGLQCWVRFGTANGQTEPRERDEQLNCISQCCDEPEEPEAAVALAEEDDEP